MRRAVFILATILFAVFLAVGARFVSAKPNFSSANLSTPGTQRTLVLPQTADSSPVISLGTAVDPQTGKKVEGLAIIHFKKEFTHKPQHQPGTGGAVNKCFSFLSNGAKWRTVEAWVVNPSNTRGLADDFVFGNVGGNVSKWEDAADGVVGNGAGVDILGAGSTTATQLSADTTAPDGSNEVYFADVSNSGAIAVTIVWGIFAGPPSQRELVEWDQVYDDSDFDWSSAGETGKMDFENISTHEIGHSTGMGHPDDSCTEETMYRFSSTGETKKRDLNTGDIAGANQLY
ncbi:matrixin family metalloprotease [Candidatus Roizmanbacteria bacterium]|nr:matrixin family metalloprotease [Candidatus Roizmanbacteria bacterium]